MRFKLSFLCLLVSLSVWDQVHAQPTPSPSAVSSPNHLDSQNTHTQKVPGTPSSSTTQANVPKGTLVAVDPPKVKMSCSPSPALLAQPVTCAVEITHSDQLTVQMNAPVGAEEGSVQLPEKQANGDLKTTRSFVMRSLELDKPIRVRGLKVNWTAVGGKTGVVDVPAQKIMIKSSLMGVSDPKVKTFKDPTGGVELKAPQTLSSLKMRFWTLYSPPALLEKNWFLLVLLGLIAAGIVGILGGMGIQKVIEIRRRNRGPYIDPRPAHVIALSELDTLLKSRLIEEGQFKAYYQGLSEVIRHYFDRRYEGQGVEMTSDEIRDLLYPLDLGSEVMMCVEDFLSETDLVKFADFNPSTQAVDRVTRTAYRVVRLTQQSEENEMDLSASNQENDQVHPHEPSTHLDVNHDAQSPSPTQDQETLDPEVQDQKALSQDTQDQKIQDQQEDSHATV